MLADWLIIDGNNLIHAQPGLLQEPGRDFHSIRRHLVQALEEMVGVLAARITVVFDGTRGGRQTGFESAAVEVVFSPSHFTADSVIERLAARTVRRDAVLVVSSDSLERHTVEASGVRSLSCRMFLEEMRLAREQLGRRIGETRRRPSGRNALGDFFP